MQTSYPLSIQENNFYVPFNTNLYQIDTGTKEAKPFESESFVLEKFSLSASVYKNLADLPLQAWPDKPKDSFIRCVVKNYPQWHKVAKSIDDLWNTLECQIKWEEFSHFCFYQTAGAFSAIYLKSRPEAYYILRVVKEKENESWADIANTISELIQIRISEDQCKRLWRKLQFLSGENIQNKKKKVKDISAPMRSQIDCSREYFNKDLADLPLQAWPNKPKDSFIRCVVENYPQWHEVAKSIDYLWNTLECQIKWENFSQFCFYRPMNIFSNTYLKSRSESYYLLRVVKEKEKSWRDVASTINNLTRVGISEDQCNQLWRKLHSEFSVKQYFLSVSSSTLEFNSLINTPLAEWPKDAKNYFIQTVIQNYPQWNNISKKINDVWNAEQCEVNWNEFIISCFKEHLFKENIDSSKWNNDAQCVFYLIYLNCTFSNLESSIKNKNPFIKVSAYLKALTHVEIDNKKCCELQKAIAIHISKKLDQKRKEDSSEFAPFSKKKKQNIAEIPPNQLQEPAVMPLQEPVFTPSQEPVVAPLIDIDLFIESILN